MPLYGVEPQADTYGTILIAGNFIYYYFFLKKLNLICFFTWFIKKLAARQGQVRTALLLVRDMIAKKVPLEPSTLVALYTAVQVNIWNLHFLNWSNCFFFFEKKK